MYERGFHETRIGDIAERAGTSAATILYYFDSKEKLLEEALTHSDEAFYARLREEIALLDSASARLVHILDRCSSPPDPLDDWTLWLEMWLQARHRPHMRRAYARLDRSGLRALIADVVDDGQRDGEFGEADVDDVATTLNAVLDGLGLAVTLGHPDVSAERMFTLCLTMASRELGCDLHAQTTTAPAAKRARAERGRTR